MVQVVFEEVVLGQVLEVGVLDQREILAAEDADVHGAVCVLAVVLPSLNSGVTLRMQVWVRAENCPSASEVGPTTANYSHKFTSSQGFIAS